MVDIMGKSRAVGIRRAGLTIRTRLVTVFPARRKTVRLGTALMGEGLVQRRRASVPARPIGVVGRDDSARTRLKQINITV